MDGRGDGDRDDDGVDGDDGAHDEHLDGRWSVIFVVSRMRLRSLSLLLCAPTNFQDPKP